MLMSNYWNNKSELKVKARKSVKYINEHYKDDVITSVLCTSIFDFDRNKLSYNDKLRGIKNLRKVLHISERHSPNLVLARKDVISCLFDDIYPKVNNSNKDYNVGVLNFASFTHPGGMFLQGSSAQEESLCHNSILFNVIKEYKKSYYDNNSGSLNRGTYTSCGLYSNNVLFFGKDKKGNINYDKTLRADVITLAAPNLSYLYKINRVDYPKNIELVNTALRNRIFALLYQFAINNCDIIVLGAYGCGVFKNNPRQVVEIFIEQLELFRGFFKYIYFPIPDTSNAKVFDNVFYNNYQLNKRFANNDKSIKGYLM